MRRTGPLICAVLLLAAGCIGGDDGVELPALAEGAVRVESAVDATGPVAVQGRLFATPARDDDQEATDGWRVELCEYLGYGDQPDVPMLLCLGDSVAVITGTVDPFDLDLGWSEENGFEQSSRVVVARGVMGDGRLRVEGVERDGEPVTATRPDRGSAPS